MSAVQIEIVETIESQDIRQRATVADPSPAAAGVVIGTLVGFNEDGRLPLVIHPRQSGTAALAAATIVDLHGAHVGKHVALQFENGDLTRPIVMGVLRNKEGWPLAECPGQVEVEADGERLRVTAKEQLVLKCGKASITLTKAGKVLIHGEYVVSRSSGMHRIKGGSVQIN